MLLNEEKDSILDVAPYKHSAPTELALNEYFFTLSGFAS